MSNLVAYTIVQRNDKHYYISTINRESSAELAYGRMYAETMVWEWDNTLRKMGDLIGQGEACCDSLHTHLDFVRRMHRDGTLEEPEEVEQIPLDDFL